MISLPIPSPEACITKGEFMINDTQPLQQAKSSNNRALHPSSYKRSHSFLHNV